VYWAAFKWWLLFGSAFFVIEAATQVAQAYLLGRLIDSINDGSDAKCYSQAAGVALLSLAYVD
jgi:ABC-type multidrug transport system fused ATPase/permease subunit